MLTQLSLSRCSIKVYENRVIKLQKLVRDGPNTTHDADKEVDNSLRNAFGKDLKQSFATCNKCGERFVKHLLFQHALYCNGESFGDGPTTTGPTEEEEEEDKTLSVGECFCDLCGKKFTDKTIAKHTKKCQERQKFLEGREGNDSSLISLLPPQKPRNVIVNKVGPDFIHLKWEPPILDGGCKVYDYQVKFNVVKIERIGKKEIKHVTEVPPMLCSRWLCRPPVASYGYTIEDLDADTHYEDIQIRCRNKIDWGPFTNPLDPIKTKPAVAPTSPLFFECVKLTSAVIAFQWSGERVQGAKRPAHKAL